MIEAMKLALEVLKIVWEEEEEISAKAHQVVFKAIESLEEALEQEQGEPVAYDVRCDNCGGDGYDPKNNNYYCSVCEGSRFVEKMLYTTPQRTWVGLTNDEKETLSYKAEGNTWTAIELAEAKLKEKNT
jgi:hypothetical protein